MRISDWSSDVCSSDLHERHPIPEAGFLARSEGGPLGADAQRIGPETLLLDHVGRRDEQDGLGVVPLQQVEQPQIVRVAVVDGDHDGFSGRTARVDLARQREREIVSPRSEEHTSELQSLMRNSYAVFFLTNKTR